MLRFSMGNTVILPFFSSSMQALRARIDTP